MIPPRPAPQRWVMKKPLPPPNRSVCSNCGSNWSKSSKHCRKCFPLEVFALLTVASLAILSLMLSGCSTVTTIKTPQSVSKIEGYRGTITKTFPDGTKTLETMPEDYKYTLENGSFTTNASAFRIQAIIGADMYTGPNGLCGSPYAGIRFFHLSYIGGDLGFDKNNLSLGLDAYIHSICFGPSIMVPYLSTKASGLGAKAGILF
jgi:hypothetical protein